MLDKFAEELREAREKSGLSLQQMAMKTRIDIKFLDAIDKGDFAFLPEPYVKAFLKDYAKMVGLDESKIVQKYEAAKKGKAVEEKTGTEPEDVQKKHEPRKNVTYDATPPPPASDSSSNNKNMMLYGGAAFGLLLLLVIYLIFFKGSDEIVVEEKPIEEVLEDNQQRFEEPAAEESVNTLSDSLRLTILSGDTSWVQIIYDNKSQEEFTLFPNSQKTIKTGYNFKITLGNSGAIKFNMNNQPLNFSGRDGSVAYVQINRDGLTYLQSPPALNGND